MSAAASPMGPAGVDAPGRVVEPTGPPAPVAPPAPAAGQPVAVPTGAHLRRHLNPLVVARHTVGKAWGDRILGLSAESAFWYLLSLPPLLLGLLGTIGQLGSALGPNTVAKVQTSILHAAGRVLAPSAVDQVVRPTVTNILAGGRADVVSVGFLTALWTGSSAMATFVNTITIAYDLRDRRGAVRSRLLALGLYLAAVGVGVVLVPALVVGPGLLKAWATGRAHRLTAELITWLYLPVVGMLLLAGLATLYHLAVPVRTPWRHALPGALLGGVLWLLGSYGLRWYFSHEGGRTQVYGALAAPVAVLLFLYVTALSILLGAELNATLDQLRPADATRLAREGRRTTSAIRMVRRGREHAPPDC